MNEVRDKLIELLKGCPAVWVADSSAKLLADRLIANGVTIQNVTVQKWIPASEPPPRKGCYFVMVRHWLDGKPVTREAYWNGADWLSCDRRHELTPRVTHWMPMPEPPKEEK